MICSLDKLDQGQCNYPIDRGIARTNVGCHLLRCAGYESEEKCNNEIKLVPKRSDSGFSSRKSQNPWVKRKLFISTFTYLEPITSLQAECWGVNHPWCERHSHNTFLLWCFFSTVVYRKWRRLFQAIQLNVLSSDGIEMRPNITNRYTALTSQ